MVTLPFMICTGKRTKKDILTEALAINNEMIIPMKILELVETTRADGQWSYDIKVEDCLDKEEWGRAIRIYFMGYNFRHNKV